ncbi:hypothetical protein AB1Y20_018558 [Prymnesium parvum]|uniref:Uncharacterized protein n=1 Tax=Prymnesium parvum TaxID=97485 RepID=A0AB34JS79_PRYPA
MPPPITSSMQNVLQLLGMRVEEKLEQKQIPPRHVAPAFAVLLPGPARNCLSTAYMESVLQPCAFGAADVTLLLQFSNESKQSVKLLDPVACRRSILEAARQSPKPCGSRRVANAIDWSGV